MNYSEYLDKFETSISKSILANRNDEIVPIKNKSKNIIDNEFSKFIGDIFKSDKKIAINYYGYYKLSSEIIDTIEEIAKHFPNIKIVKCPVIFFNSIKISDLKKVNRELVKDFYEFKDYIVKLRWNR